MFPAYILAGPMSGPVHRVNPIGQGPDDRVAIGAPLSAVSCSIRCQNSLADLILRTLASGTPYSSRSRFQRSGGWRPYKYKVLKVDLGASNPYICYAWQVPITGGRCVRMLMTRVPSFQPSHCSADRPPPDPTALRMLIFSPAYLACSRSNGVASEVVLPCFRRICWSRTLCQSAWIVSLWAKVNLQRFSCACFTVISMIVCALQAITGMSVSSTGSSGGDPHA